MKAVQTPNEKAVSAMAVNAMPAGLPGIRQLTAESRPHHYLVLKYRGEE